MLYFWTQIAINLCTIAALTYLTHSLVASSRGGAPFVPLSKRHVRHVLQLAGAGPNDTLYDLGCGDGRVLAIAVGEFQVPRAVGIDIAPLPLLFSRIRLAGLGALKKRITIRKQDFRAVDLSGATLVYTYLMPKVMEEFGEYFAKSMRPGARLVTASFPFTATTRPEFRLLKQERYGNFRAYLYERT